MSIIDQCRRLNVQIGDTIEGTETWPSGWTTCRLTLLWLGKEVAVWRETSRNSQYREWSEPREEAAWDLSCREWRHVGTEKT